MKRRQRPTYVRINGPAPVLVVVGVVGGGGGVRAVVISFIVSRVCLYTLVRVNTRSTVVVVVVTTSAAAFVV